MQHLSLFYLFITFLIGFVSLGIGVAEYLKHRAILVRYYVYFYLSLTLMVTSDLLLNYITLNLPGIAPFAPFGLNYVRVFIAGYAIMFTFPVMIHQIFEVPHAGLRNRFFGGLALLLCLGEHIETFLSHVTFIEILGVDIDNLIQMLVLFYGIVLGISQLDRLHDGERKRLAQKLVLLLGLVVPVVAIDILLKTPLAIPLYPIIYSGTGLLFTFYLIKHSAAFSHHTPDSSILPTPNMKLLTATVNESPAVQENQPDDRCPEEMLNAELFRQYNLSFREQEVLPFLVQGLSNKALAERLFISVSTVKTHLRNIYAKFGVRNRYELLALLKHGDDTLFQRPDTDESPRSED